MKRQGLLFAVLVLLVCIPTAAHATNVTGISASVHPPDWDGRCPHTFQFAGTIVGRGRGEVRYVWERSDRARGEVKTLHFSRGEERFRVIDDWRLSLGPRRSFRGFEVLHILYPINMRSNRATFDLHCR
ncbi:MAG TPA: hypothetical protein VHU41_02505 [Thermoanaerobaculia bacterium]|nr:hypothetical protein [Thermoanaerobaculia bacterium]